MEPPLKKQKLSGHQSSTRSDTKVSIWDVNNLGRVLKENPDRDPHQILMDLQSQCLSKMDLSRIDLHVFSEHHGTVLFQACTTGDLSLVQHLIKVHNLNPHFVFPSGINVMHCTHYISRERKPAEVLKYLASLGCNMELGCLHFVANDDISKYVNTKMMISFGFDLEDTADIYDNQRRFNRKITTYSVHDRIRLGFGGDIDETFGKIELLKPNKVMHQDVLVAVEKLTEKLVVNMLEIDLTDLCGVISKDIYECFCIRDICKIYQHIVSQNHWDTSLDCDFIH
eukprot:137798_1